MAKTVPEEKRVKLPEDKIIIGVDEVGRGALIGPVVAGAAVIFPDEDMSLLDELRDSKTLSPKKRVKYGHVIDEVGVPVGFGSCTQEEIDDLNIHVATLTAMQRAVINVFNFLNTRGDIRELTPDNTLIVVDGEYTIQPALELPRRFGEIAAEKADTYILPVMVAAVKAKLKRDAWVVDVAHAKYPQYGWDQSKGYTTKAHRVALEKHGVTEFHRKTFKTVAQALQNESGINWMEG